MGNMMCMQIVPLDRELSSSEYGFDYAQTVREINHASEWSYARIAQYLGYKSKATVGEIVAGDTVPDHPRGEKLYILYVEMFNRKPPIVRQTEQPSTA